MDDIKNLEYDNRGNIFTSSEEGDNKDYFLIAECLSEKWAKFFVDSAKIVNDMAKDFLKEKNICKSCGKTFTIKNGHEELCEMCLREKEFKQTDFPSMDDLSTWSDGKTIR